MNNTFIIFFLFFYLLISLPINADEQCPTVVDPLENPTEERPRRTEFLETVSSDTIVIYKSSSSKVQEAYWTLLPNCPARINPFGLITSETVQDDPSLEACVYIYSRHKTCPSGYEIDLIQGVCELENQSVCNSTPATCSDGFPPDLLGYPDCDRPPLKQCPNGDYLLDDAICPTDTTEPDPEPQPDPEPEPEPDTSYEISHVINIIRDFKEQEQNNHLESLNSLSAIKFQVRDSSNALKAGIVDSIKKESEKTNSTLRDNQELNNLNAELNREAIFTVSRSLDNLQSSFDGQNTEVVEAINNQTINLNANTDDTNSKLDTTNALLTDIKNNTAPCTPTDTNDCLSQKPNQCEPSEENSYCDNPHGLTISFMDGLLSSISDFFTDSVNEYTDTFDSNVNDIKDGSPLGEEMSEENLTGFMSFFTNLLPPPSECIPLEIAEYKGKKFYITCEFSNKFKEVFGWILAITTIFKLVSILFTGFTPNSSPQSI